MLKHFVHSAYFCVHMWLYICSTRDLMDQIQQKVDLCSIIFVTILATLYGEISGFKLLQASHSRL